MTTTPWPKAMGFLQSSALPCPALQAAGGTGACGVQVQSHPPPPPASRSLLGEGGRPLGSRGGEGRLWPPSWGGAGGGGGAAPRPPAPLGVSLPSVVSGVPPPGHTRAVGVAGRPRASGPVRSPMGQCGGGRGEGGGTPPPSFAPPSSPGRPLRGPLRLRRPGRSRSAVSRQRAGRAGACLGRGAPSSRVQRPLWGGCGAPVSSVCLRPLLGLRGRRGGEWGGHSGPLAPPPDSRGGAGWRSRPRGPAVRWGVALFPRTPLPRTGPSCRPSLGPLVPPAVVARRWPAGGGREC